VESGDGRLPPLERVEHLVAAAEQAHHPQAGRAGFLGDMDRMLEHRRVLARQKCLDLDVHVELFLHPPRATRPLQIDLRHAAVGTGGADVGRKRQEPVHFEKPLR
jgi:hypothetical protein